VYGRSRQTFGVPSEGVERTIDLIAPEEVESAVLYLVEDQFGVQRDQLPQAAGGLLGIKPVRAETAKSIGEVVDDLVERGLLRTSGFQAYLAPANSDESTGSVQPLNR
jgi:hypothetical protein